MVKVNNTNIVPDGIFLNGDAIQEASDVHPMGEIEQRLLYKLA